MRRRGLSSSLMHSLSVSLGIFKTTFTFLPAFHAGGEHRLPTGTDSQPVWKPHSSSEFQYRAIHSAWGHSKGATCLALLVQWLSPFKLRLKMYGDILQKQPSPFPLGLINPRALEGKGAPDCTLAGVREAYCCF